MTPSTKRATQGQHHRLRVLPDNVETEALEGTSILEASLQAGVVHCHDCLGHARCSTCRVLVVEGLDACAPRNDAEQGIAERLGFPSEVRLACQTRVSGDLVVRRLVLDDLDANLTSLARRGALLFPVGREQDLAILFLDIRGFTSFSERLPPYDVIHFLRRFFALMNAIVQRFGGVVNNYMGDGMLALFGTDDVAAATLRAVRAGLEMLDEADRLKPYEQAIGGQSLDIRVGVHFGSAVVGALGSAESPRVTAIGDSVNMASRVEEANKTTGTRLLVSEPAYREIQRDVSIGRSFAVSLRGKSGTHTLYEIVALRTRDAAVENGRREEERASGL
jgi:adenylate cyclase